MNRWWIYQRERFPLVAHGSMILIFVASVLLFSALRQADFRVPETAQLVGAFLSALILFFQLRVADEFKDFDIDCRYRPHRPVPRGLVSLHELAALAFAGAVLQFGIALWLDVGLVPILVGVWTYLWLMTREFYVPAWLKRRPVVYLLSHMLIMPVIAFYVSAFDWLSTCKEMPTGLGSLLAVSFCAGLVLEIGRKIRAPANEQTGVETYSALWGTRNSVLVWLVAVAAVSAGLVVALSFITPVWPLAGIPIAILLLVTGSVGAAPLLRQSSGVGAGEKWIEPVSGIVAGVAYLSLGPVQLLIGG